MKTQYTGVGILLLLALSVVLSVVLYPFLPATTASPWNSLGASDANMSTFCTLFIYPLLLIFTFAAWVVIPRIEPMQKNLLAFRHAYNGFWLVLAMFIFYMFVLTLGRTAGWEFDFNQYVAPGVALLLASITILLAHSRRNYLVGIRTPWTLSSDKVWKRTHVMASHLFYMCAVWAFAGIIFPQYLSYLIIIPLVTAVIIATIYSYIEYKRTKV